jgi:DMSO/TMAO reductase YedYZ molybdopterin-dependent catalytic subunit
VGWEKGAVGNAEWSGVRLLDVLKRAGIKPDAAHVQLHGADTPPNPKTPAFFRSIPLSRALDPGTILATSMNGEALPLLHGGPIRLVVPGWCGNHWIKWLRKVTVAKEEAPGFYQQTGYKMPKIPAPPGADLKPTDLTSVTTLNVKSLIARPIEGATLKPGPIEVRGVAWTGEGTVEKVEVSTGPDRPWALAKLLGDPRPGTWRPWTLTWDAPLGRHTLRARATDSKGETQPEATPWNRSGYLWNGIDRVTCEVR